ncbi:MAG: protein-L-isoaspartate(D-aspartate) O-methyltransferase [Planctomycetaceae bacterium]|nr:protein-L-isoaspartate(D-aspartate) O-methyltransferase [Planctomycetaceae bacterium]
MDEFSGQRERLLATLKSQGITDDRVLAALASVPRERFVPDAIRAKAYENVALPIGQGQTISQPFIVGMMSQLLRLSGNEKVLEIGTGSGYQTAILSRLCRKVDSVERIAELAQRAAIHLAELGSENVELHTGDGTLGWKAGAPYDAIIVTAGAPDVPSPLYNQLKIGGRLVIPVGDEDSQELQVIMKRESGPDITDVCDCRFVKLIGDAGWNSDDSN